MPRFRFAARAMSSVALLLLALTSVAAAQDTSAVSRDTVGTKNLRPTPAAEQVVVILRDGSRLVGRVLDVAPTTIRFASAIGETTIPRSSIADVQRVNAANVHDGQVWPENPSRTRLFFAPTGRMLRSGELYFSDVDIFFPSLQGGLTDHVSLGGGVSVIPGLSLDQQLLYFTPKVGVYASDNVNVAAGALVATAKDLTDQSPFGIGYGVVTFGSDDNSLTTGAGFGFSRGSHSNALLMIGGETRVARSLSLVTENYLYAGNGNNSVLSGGVRILSEHIAVDLALAGSPGNSTIIPYLSFIYKW